jgi:integrase/recombinase XerD
MSQKEISDCKDLSMISSVILHSPESAHEVAGNSNVVNRIPKQADTDEQLIELWLHGRPATTQRAYRTDIAKLIEFVNKPLPSVTLGDLQTFVDSLEMKPTSVRRTVNSVKSLFAFGYKLGYLKFDVGRALRVQAIRDELAQRILSEEEVQRILASERNPRNKAILLTFYGGGFRVSEIASLKWCHLQERGASGQITVFGKGGKTRSVLVPKSVWNAITAIRKGANDDQPVFKSRKKGHLDESAIWRIVKNAAKKAGLDKAVSCHWFRHSHASHALDAGAPIHLVQTTLGHASIATTGRYLHARPAESSGSYVPNLG